MNATTTNFRILRHFKRPISNFKRSYRLISFPKILINDKRYCYNNVAKIYRYSSTTSFDQENVEEEEEEQNVDNAEQAKEMEEQEEFNSITKSRLFSEWVKTFVDQNFTENGDQEENCRKLRSSAVEHESEKYSRVGERSIDSRILKTLMAENLHRVAFCYVKFLDKNNSFNPASAILTAEILYKMRKMKLIDESYILYFYEKILEKNYSSFFKISPMVQLYCLATTSRYNEALEILRSSPVLKSSPQSYFFLASCLVDQNLFQKAMDLLEQFKNLGLIVAERSPYTAALHESVLNFLLQKSNSREPKVKSKILNSFIQYVDFLYDVRCSGVPSDLDHVIKAMFQNLNKKYEISPCQIVKGRCTNCDEKMENEELTGEDFELMRRQVLHRLIKGDDVFRNTNPKEMQIFLRFIERNKPYDLVFDSLNLAFSGLGRKLLPKDRPIRLLNTVRNFKEYFGAKKSCLISRRHFFKNNETGLAQICKFSDVYLLDNKSIDDPFILYAALSSGRNCYAISNDFYAFLNETLDPKIRSLFLRWRRTRLITNVFVNVAGVPSFDTPPTFSVRCQRRGDHFHLPLIDRNDLSATPPTVPSSTAARLENRLVVSPCSWLCIRKSPDDRIEK